LNLHDLTAQLADVLGRSVDMVDSNGDPIVAGVIGGVISDPGRVTVPVRDSTGPIAFFRLATDRAAPLSPSHFAFADAAASIAVDLLVRDNAAHPHTTRQQVMRRLLDDDLGIRRAALTEAVSKRWVDRGTRTVVRAVMVEDSVNKLRRVALGRQLEAATSSRTDFIHEVESIVYLITRDARSDAELDRWIQDKSDRLGIPVLAIGSAHHHAFAGDLGDAADQARVAAELSAALPELQPSCDFTDLGGWLLLHAVSAGTRRLSDISPAAEQLCGPGDPQQRLTIETYLDAGGQARTACERLHIHRTTLYYRLDNMPPVVRDALEDGMTRSTLHLALKLARLWEATGAIEHHPTRKDSTGAFHPAIVGGHHV